MGKNELTNQKFVQDNRLITAQYSKSISIIGQKLIRLAIAKIDSVKDTSFFQYTVSVREITDSLKISDTKNIYRDIKKASAELLKTQVLIEQVGARKGSYRRYNLFSFFDYNDGLGQVTIQFNSDMTPFLLMLKSHFTQIPLEDVLFLEHKYSIRVYELINMKLYEKYRKQEPFADTHYQIEITVDELRKATNSTTTYKQIGQLKSYILFPSLVDIEEKTQRHCEVKDIKEGRIITGFELDVWSTIGWQHNQLRKDQIPGQTDIFDYIGSEHL